MLAGRIGYATWVDPERSGDEDDEDVEREARNDLIERLEGCETVPDTRTVIGIEADGTTAVAFERSGAPKP